MPLFKRHFRNTHAVGLLYRLGVDKFVARRSPLHLITINVARGHLAMRKLAV